MECTCQLRSIRTFAFEPFNIPSESMLPNLLVGDYLFVSKFAYGYSRYSLPFGLGFFSGRIFGSVPERGDVAVFRHPPTNRDDFIKRIVGLPGDRLHLQHGPIDLVIEAGLSNYDIQAPMAVIEAAGGIVTDWQGRPAHAGGRVLAAAGRWVGRTEP